MTNATDYLGAEVVHQLAPLGTVSVTAAVRDAAAAERLLPAGISLACVDLAADGGAVGRLVSRHDVVIHAAGVFRGCSDFERDLVTPNAHMCRNVLDAAAHPKAAARRIVLTSSMAAVRGPGQAPGNGVAFTAADWNTKSRRDGPGMKPYQYSKTETECSAWRFVDELAANGGKRIELAQSVAMVRKWVTGDAAVESRLAVDVRDAARAHVLAALAPASAVAGRRLLLSCEAREAAAALAEALRGALPHRTKIHADANFVSAVPVGAQEAVAADGLLARLGMRLRPARETMLDLARLADREPGL
ncbi:hypothetical protein M885DRAFT_623830 [Pelagophyceae sp. CCMP2097]|nr:hypothetical protein M885DRAFT_623830 [Pelagophyceae sp. CCMP2097]